MNVGKEEAPEDGENSTRDGGRWTTAEAPVPPLALALDE